MALDVHRVVGEPVEVGADETRRVRAGGPPAWPPSSRSGCRAAPSRRWAPVVVARATAQPAAAAQLASRSRRKRRRGRQPGTDRNDQAAATARWRRDRSSAGTGRHRREGSRRDAVAPRSPATSTPRPTPRRGRWPPPASATATRAVPAAAGRAATGDRCSIVRPIPVGRPDRRWRYGAIVIDVVLPALDEAAALPERPGAHARRLPADRGRQRIDRRHRRRGPRPRRRRRGGARTRLRRRLLSPGCAAATVRRRVLHGRRRLARPPSIWSWWRGRSSRAGPISSSAPGDPSARAWPVHARARQLGAGHRGAPPHRHPHVRPRADARRPPACRCSPSASPTGDRVGRSRWCCGRPGPGWRIDEVPVPYAPRIGRSKVTGTVRGTVQAVRDMRRVLAS